MNTVRSVTFRFTLILVALALGCAPGKRIRGIPGTTSAKAQTGSKATATQSENAKGAATVHLESDTTMTLPVHKGDVVRILKSAPVASTELNPQKQTNAAPSAAKVEAGFQEMQFTFGDSSELKIQTHDEIRTSTGTAREDLIGVTEAKMETAKYFVWGGGVMIVLGIAFAFVPYLTLLVGGHRLYGLVAALAGALFTCIPFVVVGQETMIICGIFVVGGAAVFYWIHHHGVNAGRKAGKDLLNRIASV